MCIRFSNQQLSIIIELELNCSVNMRDHVMSCKLFSKLKSFPCFLVHELKYLHNVEKYNEKCFCYYRMHYKTRTEVLNYFHPQRVLCKWLSICINLAKF